jgi:hypothetical protein
VNKELTETNDHNGLTVADNEKPRDLWVEAREAEAGDEIPRKLGRSRIPFG